MGKLRKLIEHLIDEWNRKTKIEKLLIAAECLSGFTAGLFSATITILIRKLLGG
jgi:hypothetical protein